jgi:hypothetical protein
VHNLPQRPNRIKLNGEELKSKNHSWNPVTNKLMIQVTCTTEKATVTIEK